MQNIVQENWSNANMICINQYHILLLDGYIIYMEIILIQLKQKIMKINYYCTIINVKMQNVQQKHISLTVKHVIKEHMLINVKKMVIQHPKHMIYSHIVHVQWMNVMVFIVQHVVQKVVFIVLNVYVFIVMIVVN